MIAALEMMAQHESDRTQAACAGRVIDLLASKKWASERKKLNPPMADRRYHSRETPYLAQSFAGQTPAIGGNR